jgi:hypothetical protein
MLQMPQLREFNGLQLRGCFKIPKRPRRCRGTFHISKVWKKPLTALRRHRAEADILPLHRGDRLVHQVRALAAFEAVLDFTE